MLLPLICVFFTFVGCACYSLIWQCVTKLSEFTVAIYAVKCIEINRRLETVTYWLNLLRIMTSQRACIYTYIHTHTYFWRMSNNEMAISGKSIFNLQFVRNNWWTITERMWSMVMVILDKQRYENVLWKFFMFISIYKTWIRCVTLIICLTVFN
jgi:hypothetical protein